MRRTVILLGVAILSVAAAPMPTKNAQFSQAMDSVTRRMMSAMHSRPSDNVDRQFVEMMIPHHQSAIDMATAELRYGTDPQLRRMARDIVVQQGQEIATMQRVLARLPQTASHSNDR